MAVYALTITCLTTTVVGIANLVSKTANNDVTSLSSSRPYLFCIFSKSCLVNWRRDGAILPRSSSDKKRIVPSSLSHYCKDLPIF